MLSSQLTYTALLRQPSHLSVAEKHDKVDQILTRLRLQKCGDTKIRLISGGEKKRVNIGTELLAEPLLLLLDEPTTGLDSTSANALVEMLVDLAREKRTTVIMSLHQPSSKMFQTFDRILLLTDSFVVYHGTPLDSINYLSGLGHECPRGYNAADHWMDLLLEETSCEGGPSEHTREKDRASTASDEESLGGTNPTSKRLDTSEKNWGKMFRRRRSTLSELIEESFSTTISKQTVKSNFIRIWRYQQGGANAVSVAPVESTKEESKNITSFADLDLKYHGISWFTQLRILTHRSMKNNQSVIFSPINCIKSICLGVLSGLLWFQMPYTEEAIPDRSSYFFFTMQFWVFNALFNALLSLPPERTVIHKVSRDGPFYLLRVLSSKILTTHPVVYSIYRNTLAVLIS